MRALPNKRINQYSHSSFEKISSKYRKNGSEAFSGKMIRNMVYETANDRT